jgi:hypothetical protein
MNEIVKIGPNPILDSLTLDGLADTATVVLIGSAARGAMTGCSDIDILVVDDAEHGTRLESQCDIHFQHCTRSKFLSRLENGDDYPGWALRFGLPVRDPDGWWAKHVAAEIENPHWPDWRPKVVHARKRISAASELLDIGDVDAASEEMMFAATHVARAVLLKRGIFPLSRPELPYQLQDIEPTLACFLERLITRNMNLAELKSGLSLMESQIEQLAQTAAEAPPHDPSLHSQAGL